MLLYIIIAAYFLANFYAWLNVTNIEGYSEQHPLTKLSTFFLCIAFGIFIYLFSNKIFL